MRVVKRRWEEWKNGSWREQKNGKGVLSLSESLTLFSPHHHANLSSTRIKKDYLPSSPTRHVSNSRTRPRHALPTRWTRCACSVWNASKYASSPLGTRLASIEGVNITTDQDGQRFVALSSNVRAYAQGGGYWAIAIGDERLPWLTADDVRLYASTL